jgi:putative addiction module killer protein
MTLWISKLLNDKHLPVPSNPPKSPFLPPEPFREVNWTTTRARGIFAIPPEIRLSSQICKKRKIRYASVSNRIHCMPVNSFIATPEFEHWLGKLRDPKGKARILSRLDSAALGNFGDCQYVGEGVSEMRIHFGPGYRVYFTRRGKVVYVLLIGGDKSTQKRDIKRALNIARELKT